MPEHNDAGSRGPAEETKEDLEGDFLTATEIGSLQGRGNNPGLSQEEALSYGDPAAEAMKRKLLDQDIESGAE